MGLSPEAAHLLSEKNGAVFMCCCFALPCLYDTIYMYLSADQHLREGVSLWWLQDTRFEIPRVNMHCSIESVGAEKSPRWMGTLIGCILYWYRYILHVQYINYSRHQEKSTLC